MTEILRHHTIVPQAMRRVILESPYAGDIGANLKYARDCVRDSLLRGEAPLASHLLYTQPGILNDEDRNERAHGINAGHAWMHLADAVVVYIDHGVSDGMAAGIRLAEAHNVPIERRSLYPGGDEAVISTRHKWSARVALRFKTERQCSRCEMVRVTRHDNPQGRPWIEYWRDLEQISCEATPLCDARLEREAADNLEVVA
jgi:hypothetical protein